MNVLLVDDEYISNFINQKLIENVCASIPVTAFSNPTAAYEHLLLIKPDLIFLDINMPVMTGWDFLDKMAAEKIHYKVVILTSSVNTIDRAMAMNYNNVIGYIEKPATLASIAPYITALLGKVA